MCQKLDLFNGKERKGLSSAHANKYLEHTHAVLAIAICGFDPEDRSDRAPIDLDFYCLTKRPFANGSPFTSSTDTM